MWELRLGDELDDFCVKCRRLTNHLIVSLVDAKAAKVRCRSCYSDHDYRNEQAPPSKKELAKQKELVNAALAGAAPAEIDLETPLAVEITASVEVETEIVTEKKPAAAKKKKR
jgi:hypothetical protein